MNNLSGSENFDSEKWEKTFNDFEKEYKKAYYNIHKAIELDEEGKSKEALPLYEIGLNLIDEALSKTSKEPSKPDLLWEKAVVMSKKLQKTRTEIIIRIENVTSKPDIPADELPPSYEEIFTDSKSGTAGTSNGKGDAMGNNLQPPETPSTDSIYIPSSAIQDEELLANLHFSRDGSSSNPITYSDLSQQLKEMKLAKNEEILFHCDNVQLYFISSDGRVSSTAESHTLIIARIHDESLDQLKRTFLQVGSWIYPLIPNVSPIIRSEYGAFILPDINSEVEGAAVGIVVPEEVRDDLHVLFNDLQNDISESGRSRRSVAADFSPDNFSSRIGRGAAYLAHSLVRGAGSTARFLDISTPKIIDRINPYQTPKPINPTLQKSFEVAKSVSAKAVDVTDYLASKVCMATSALGRYLSPYIQKQGSRILANTTNLSEEEATEKINSVLNIASDAVSSMSTVYTGLDTAATILARSLAANTVQIIEYKYGPPATALTNDAFTTFGNIYYAHHNFKVLRPRGIVKAAVRGTGQALLEDYRNSQTNLKQHEEIQYSKPEVDNKSPSTS